jgi:hypothetical protein
MKKVYQKWTDYERALIITHHRQFGIANKHILASRMPYRSFASVSCELDKFHIWRNTGIMEYTGSYRHRNNRAGVRATYTRIIKDLGL